MAYLRGGNSRDDSILIDDDPVNTTERSRAPHVRRPPARLSNPAIPTNVSVVCIDDDDNDLEIISAEAWVEEVKTRDSRLQPVVTGKDNPSAAGQLSGTASTNLCASSAKPDVSTGSADRHSLVGVGPSDSRPSNPDSSTGAFPAADLPQRSRPVQPLHTDVLSTIKRDGFINVTPAVPTPHRFPLLAQLLNRDQSVTNPANTGAKRTADTLSAIPSAQKSFIQVVLNEPSQDQSVAEPPRALRPGQLVKPTPRAARATTSISNGPKRVSVERQSAALVDSRVRHVASPIGDVANRISEQVLTSGTRNIVQDAGVDAGAATNSVTFSVPAKVRKSHGASVTKVHEKQMARKSVIVKADKLSRKRIPVKVRHQTPETDTAQDRPAVGSSRIRSLQTSPMQESSEADPIQSFTVVHELRETSLSLADNHFTEETPAGSTHHELNGHTLISAKGIGACASNQRVEPSVLKSLMPAANMAIDPTQIEVETPRHNVEEVDVSNKAAYVVPLHTAIAVDHLEVARSAVKDCLKRHLKERHEAHAYSTESLLWRQRTCQESEFHAQHNRRNRTSPPVLPVEYLQEVSPFMGMSQAQTPFDKSSTNGSLRSFSQETFTKAKLKDLTVTSIWSATPTLYECNAVTIPPFKEYVSLRINLLADNESRLLATPYFQDENDDSRKEMLDALPHQYEMKHDEQGPIDLRTEQVRFFKHSFEAFLEEVHVSWNAILYWLFAKSSHIKHMNKSMTGSHQFEAHLVDRSRYDIEEFERDEEQVKNELFNRESKKCQAFFRQLKPIDAKELRLSALICEAVFQECNFNIWYLAQHSELVRDYVWGKTKGPQADAMLTYRQATCRVCHEHNCMFHGELRELPEDSSDSESSGSDDSIVQDAEEPELSRTGRRVQPVVEKVHTADEDDSSEDDELPAHFDDDSDVEKVVNYRLHMNSDALAHSSEHISGTVRGSKPPDGKFNPKWWRSHTQTRIWEKRKPFYPCKHEGSCEQAQCKCYRENVNCEKNCQCSRTCNRRFPGCSCTFVPGRRICSAASCLCLKFNRECDADLCGTCGAIEILDPVNKYNEDVLQGRCSNVAIQRGVPKKTLLGESTVHGFGLYAGEDISQNDYIGEYRGEIISVKEGDRRSTIYGYQQTMYLFKLNTKQEVDATYMGNKLRFINNADKKYTNCYPQNLLCNMVFRIALYASTDIKAGTEFFFDYNYPKEMTEHFKQPSQPKGAVVAVKKLVKPKAKEKPSSPPVYNMSTSSSVPKERKASAAVLAATAVARATRAKKAAEKLAASLAEQSLQSSASNSRTVPQRARKSAINGARQGRSSRVSQLRVRKSARNRPSQENSDTSDTPMETDDSDSHVSQLATQQSLYRQVEVQDTDEEDEDFVLGNMQETQDSQGIDEEAEATAAEDSDDGTSHRPLGRTRRSMPSMTPVIAVKKKVKKKLGGVRPGAGRPGKRKRPMVVNSDDE